MRFRNTTDIPDQLIAIAVAHSIESGVEIDEIIIKNKAEGKTLGQWGWYKPHSRTIVIIVPQVVERVSGRRTYTREPYFITSRAEFLVMVMAHELRHAYQHQVRKELMNRKNHIAHEHDAEHYEQYKLQQWRKRVWRVGRSFTSVIGGLMYTLTVSKFGRADVMRHRSYVTIAMLLKMVGEVDWWILDYKRED